MKSIANQIPLLEDAIRSGGTYTVYSPGYRLWGLLLITAGTIEVLALAYPPGPPNTTPMGLWAGVCAFSNVQVALGVIIGWVGSLTVTPNEIRVVNPFYQAWIPWASVTGADGHGIGLSFTTTGPKVRVWVIERANWEAGVPRAERIAEIIRDKVDRGHADSPPGQTSAPVRKRWRLWPYLWPSLAAADAILYYAIVQLNLPGVGR